MRGRGQAVSRFDKRLLKEPTLRRQMNLTLMPLAQMWYSVRLRRNRRMKYTILII